MIYVAPENQPAFDAMKANLETELAPKGELQLSFFLTILHATWNAQRCIALEAGLQNEANSRGLADAMFDDEELARKLDRLYRYKKMHETTRRQAIAELRKLQTEAFFRNEPKSESAAEQQPSILVDTTKSARTTRQPKPQPDPLTTPHDIDAEIRALTTYAVRNLKRPPIAA